MNETPAGDLSIAQRVDTLSDRFEAEFTSGNRPRIEAFLADAPDWLRQPLFVSLLDLKLELRRRAGDKPAAAEYQQRFPQYRQEIEQSFARLGAVKPPSEQSSIRPTSVETAPFVAGARNPVASAPKTLGRFEILDLLGEGAFGAVYRARDPQLDREVAIKVPRSGSLPTEEERQRFLREARSAAGLHHPNICPVHEVGTHEGRDYIVMAYIDGKPLSKFIQGKAPLSERQIAGTVRKLALALEEAHAQGIVHRDLKPANVMVNRKGEPVIMDFGLARRDNSGDAVISQSGQIMGTPAYMSPEQARGDSKHVGPHADIYSLGVVLYEMLCGQRPFKGTVTEVIGQILHVEPPRPGDFKLGISPQLELICLKALAKEPAQRFQSMKQLAAALGDFLKATQAAAAPRAADPVPAPMALPAEAGQAATESYGDPLRTSQLDRLVAAVSSDVESKVHRAVSQAAHQAASRHKSPPWWLILTGAGAAALVLLAAIWFFIRKDTVTVIVNIPGIDTKDPSLSFFLDKRQVPAEEFLTPIELLPGEHELIVNKDDKLFKRFLFNVGKADNQPVVVQDVTPVNEPIEVAGPPVEDGFLDLFNGQDLANWQIMESETPPGSSQRFTLQKPAAGGWEVRDGNLVCATKNPGWLKSKQTFGDFTLQLEFKLPPGGNSGIYFRTLEQGHISKVGMEAQLVDESRDDVKPMAPQFHTGAIHGIAGPTAQVPTPTNTWHTLELDCQGDAITVKLNGTIVTQADLKTIPAAQGRPRSGFIGISNWAGEADGAAFRDIRIRQYPAVAASDGWIELFNGQDLAGWASEKTGQPMGAKVENGYIQIIPGQGSSIVTTQDFPLDLEMHAEFWLPDERPKNGQRSNSGIYLHGRHEIQICDSFENDTIPNPKNGCGALYGEIAPLPGGPLPPETWQSFDIVLRGPRVDANKQVTTPGRLTLTHNGKKVIDNAPFSNLGGGLRHNENFGQPGPIMLQQHGSAVRFRNLRVRPLVEQAAAGDWRPLMDLAEFGRWDGLKGLWSFQDGVLTGRAPQEGTTNTFLFSPQPLGDFEFKCQVRLAEGDNSGIQVRSEAIDKAKWQARGPQADMGQKAENTWGGLYGEQLAGWLLKPSNPPTIAGGQWADYSIKCVGNRVTIQVNGQTTVDGDVPEMAPNGLLAFQIHAKNQQAVEFRDMQIRDLPAASPAIPVDATINPTTDR
ncbi:MAG: family 16 glycoside hydrolase [Pirellulales bacterium]